MKLFTATLDSWTLAILDITDSLDQSLHVHEYINTDGGDVQPLGAHPRKIRFRTFWFGDVTKEGIQIVTGSVPQGSQPSITEGSGDPPTYLNHFDFLQWLSSYRTGNTIKLLLFTHPKYGPINGYVQNFQVSHDDTQDYCSIDIEFVQDGILNTTFPSTQSISLTASQVNQLNNVMTNTNKTIKAAGNAAIIGVAINKAISIVNQIYSSVSSQTQSITNKLISTQTRVFIQEVQDNLTVLSNYLNQIPDVDTSVDTAASYSNDITGTLTYSMSHACTRLFTSLSNIESSPKTFVSNAISSLTKLSVNLTGTNQTLFQTMLQSIGAGALLNKASQLLVSDEANNTISDNNAFDIYGNRVGSVTVGTPISKQDIESMTYLIQNYVQGALSLERDQPALKDMMAKMNNYVNSVKLNSQSVMTITVSNTSLHQLLCQLGQSYENADIILSLNPQIKNPAFLNGPIKVYATA